MKTENHNHLSDHAAERVSFEEQLLLSYDNYLNGSYSAALAMRTPGSFERRDDHYESQPDENEWEEEEADEDLSELDENQKEPGTFLM